MIKGVILPGILHQHSNRTVVDFFQASLTRNPKKTALLFEGKRWTFQEVEDYSNRIANYFESCGYEKGDVIALFMESRPEFVCMWLGLAKIGVISALINFSLRVDSLLHCVKACQAKGLVFGTELCGRSLKLTQTVRPMQIDIMFLISAHMGFTCYVDIT